MRAINEDVELSAHNVFLLLLEAIMNRRPLLIVTALIFTPLPALAGDMPNVPAVGPPVVAPENPYGVNPSTGTVSPSTGTVTSGKTCVEYQTQTLTYVCGTEQIPTVVKKTDENGNEYTETGWVERDKNCTKEVSTGKCLRYE
jgi:hypothetical protein